MNEDKSNHIFIFPKWTWVLRPAVAVGAVGGLLYATVVVAFGFSPKATDVGYQPVQPVPYSHALHVGQLGMDCRYCHTTVEHTAAASIPPTQTCMNCHKMVRSGSEKLIPVLESYATGMPVEWIRVHDLPDYVYFNHSAHVRRGVGCVSCHDNSPNSDPEVPYLTSQKPDYLAKQMTDFRDGNRETLSAPGFHEQILAIPDDQIAAIAAYLASEARP